MIKKIKELMMRRYILSFLLLGNFVSAQVSIGKQSLLESPDKGWDITRPAVTSVIANPVKGMIVYDRSVQCVRLYNGTVWNCIKRSCND